jgi:outer membrane cobalamin receptor
MLSYIVYGKTGWRLPDKTELHLIYFSSNDFEQWSYWSATEHDRNHTWVQYFSDGYQYDGPNDYDGYYVRAIRDIK